KYLKIISSGPFYIEQAIDNNYINLTKNTYWWRNYQSENIFLKKFDNVILIQNNKTESWANLLKEELANFVQISVEDLNSFKDHPKKNFQNNFESEIGIFWN